MKILWVILTIGLAIGEKLDRTYLPPPGSAYSGGSPGAINVPLELPKIINLFHDKEFTETPKVAIGIDTVGPSQVIENFEDISTHKPKISQNDYYYTSTKSPSTNFRESTPFPLLDSYSSEIPELSYSEHPSNDLDNDHNSENRNINELPSPYSGSYTTDIPKEIENLNGYSSTSTINKYDNISYLPPHSESYKNLISSTTPSQIYNEHENSKIYNSIQPNYNHKNTSSLNPLNKSTYFMPSNLPHSSNKLDNHKSTNRSQSSTSQFLSTTPISIVNSQSLSQKGQNNRIQAESDRKATILNYDQVKTPEGYAYSYDTSNGIHGDESGTTSDGTKAKGSYSYIGDDGKLYEVIYTADENGFVPKGAHLPTSPPIPEAILKVIEQAAKEKQAGIYDDGSYDEGKYGYKKYQVGYPHNKANNLLSEKDEIYNKNNYQIDELTQNNLGKDTKSHVDVIVDNIDSTIRDIFYDNTYQNINTPNKNIVLNENYHDHSIQLPNSINELETPTGYQYFPPQNKHHDTNSLHSFPSRFAGNTDDLNETTQQKVTPKPFLTPYVSRDEDDSENDDFNENSLGNYPEDYNDRDQNHSSFVQYHVKPNNSDTEANSPELVPGKINEQLHHNGDKHGHDLVPSGEEGYFYQEGSKDELVNQRPKPNVFYTSTAIPTQFPSRFTSTPINDPTSIPYDSRSTKTPLHLPQMQKIHPIYEEKAYRSSYPEFDKTELNSLDKGFVPSRLGLTPDGINHGTSHRPSTEETVYSDINNGPAENGEHFNGPKQAQRFDPISGYYY